MKISSAIKEKIQNKNCIIFTDLDGTLLNHDSYTLGKVPELLKNLADKNCPVIFNTSKTQAEVELLQNQLSYYNPCIVENGGGVYIPQKSTLNISSNLMNELNLNKDNEVDSIRRRINKVLDDIGQEFKFQRMIDWSDQQVAEHTGLTLAHAHLANQRFYSEPLLWQDSENQLLQFRILVDQHHLRLVRGGRFCHVMKQHDKSTYMKIMIEDYFKKNGFKPLTIALGDNENDKNMLEYADIACVLTLPGKSTMKLDHDCVFYPERPAPDGWTDIISKLFNFEI